MTPYQAHFEPAPEGGYVITFPDFTWGVSQAETDAEASEMAADLLQLLLAEHIRTGLELPEPKRHRGANYRAVQLPVMAAAKLELYREFRRSGLRKAGLARKLGIPRANIDRLFDLNHHSRFDQIEAALRLLGKTINLSVVDAA